jgi:DNA-3-methyladenine glycosylase I
MRITPFFFLSLKVSKWPDAFRREQLTEPLFLRQQTFFCLTWASSSATLRKSRGRSFGRSKQVPKNKEVRPNQGCSARIAEWNRVKGKMFLGANMQQKQAIRRCLWVDLTKPDYIDYHDKEWGVPVREDQRLFEFLILEGAQAGLSWYTVLRKRENYRIAFDHFDPEKVAKYDEEKVQELLTNPGIIRNKAKILAAINNAQRFLKIQEEFASFDSYIWRFVNGKPIVNELRRLEDYPATSRESDALSKDLRQRGFKFVGSTVCYAHMQATGMVNDHTVDCFRRQEIVDGYSGEFSGPPQQSMK